MIFYKTSPYKTAIKKLLEPRNAEANIQVAIVNLLRLTLKDAIIFSIPNERNITNPISRIIAKMMGRLAGASDLQVLVNNKVYFLEIKTEKGKQSPEQKEFEFNVKKQGHTYILMRNLDTAEKFVNSIKKEDKNEKRI